MRIKKDLINIRFAFYFSNIKIFIWREREEMMSTVIPI